MCKKQMYIASAAIAVAVVTMLLFFPISGTAGSLDPGAAPAPTMKTLDQIPPTWDQKLQCDTTACPRFQKVLDGASAVLDKETGLVWELSASTMTFTWEAAQNHCNTLTTGGRLGWRIPTIQEMASLIDPSVPSSVPAGIFTNVLSGDYWSATTSAADTTIAWHVGFPSPNFVYSGSRGVKSALFFVWCVRGGQGVDPQ